MPSMILHHFEASPFSERIRVLFGYKGAAWQSVPVPRIMPKPDLVELTGGYRKTPVLQIGRDLYCDTRLIARTIEARHPRPSVLPAAQAASIAALEQLADRRLFLAAIPVLFRSAGRAVLFSGGQIGRPDESFSRAVWGPTLGALEAQLADSDFLLGDVPTLADFAVYHRVWYVRGNAGCVPAASGLGRPDRGLRPRSASGQEAGARACTGSPDHDLGAAARGGRRGRRSRSGRGGLGHRSGHRLRHGAGGRPAGARRPDVDRDRRRGPHGAPVRVHLPRDGFDVQRSRRQD